MHTHAHTHTHTHRDLSLSHSICSPLNVSVLNQTTNQNPHKCLHTQTKFVRITKTSADLEKHNYVCNLHLLHGHVHQRFLHCQRKEKNDNPHCSSPQLQKTHKCFKDQFSTWTAIVLSHCIKVRQNMCLRLFKDTLKQSTLLYYP